MIPTQPLSAEEWAKTTYERVDLGDRRRNARAVQMASAMARRPSASLPMQMGEAAALKAAYRFLDNDAVSLRALARPHWEATRHAASAQQVVLLIQDVTELDYSPYRTTTGLGPIGDGRAQGLLLHSTLAVVPSTRTVLGVAYQAPFVRQAASEPKGAGADKRRHRPRESQVWEQATQQIGPPPAGVCWVHVGDRYADIFDWMEGCLTQACHFLIRAAQDRRVPLAEGESTYLLQLARSLPMQAQQELALPARPKRPARVAQVAVAWQAVRVQAPAYSKHKAPLNLWVLRVWEPTPPPDVEGLDWVLLSSLPIESVEDAWQRRDWYCCRWLIEDYHQCLKSGCQVEQRHLHSAEGLKRLLGFLGPLAAYLLMVRQLARQQPQALAAAFFPPEQVALLALLAAVPTEELTLDTFWRTVAQQGGYLGRPRDGPPGWKTLWRGWLHIQALLEGIQLAARLTPHSCG